MISRSALSMVADSQNALTYQTELEKIQSSEVSQREKNLELAALMSRIESETELPGLTGLRLEQYKKQYPKTYAIYLEVSNSRVF